MSEIKPVYQAKARNDEWIDCNINDLASAEALRAQGIVIRILYPEAAYEALQADNDKLRKQLPEGMQGCTIQFKKCDKGHGWLTAANWIQHDCDICRIEALQAENKHLQGELKQHKTVMGALYTVVDTLDRESSRRKETAVLSPMFREMATKIKSYL